MRQETRVRSLDGLRGIAAVAVMAFHFNLFFLPQAQLPFLGRAYLSVDLFFLLSGFVMAHVYGHALASNWRAHWKRFALARFARIYPSFSITTFGVVLLVGLCSVPSRQVSFSSDSLALQPLLMEQWCSGLSWNYPTWSISTEAEAYLFFVFFAGLLIKGSHPRLVTFCCLVVLLLLGIIGHGSINYVVGLPALLRTLAGFSLGVLLYRANLRQSDLPRRWIGLLSIMLAIAFVITRIDFVAICAFSCLIYYSVTANDLFSKLLNSRPFITLGNLSYSIYLLHAPIHFAVMVAFAACLHPVGELDFQYARTLLFGTALVVVALASVHNRYIETPLRHWLVRIGRQGKAQQAQLLEKYI